MASTSKLNPAEIDQLTRLSHMTALLYQEVLIKTGSGETARAAVKGAMPELTRKAFTNYAD